jgi:hypothetical protein
LSSRDKVTCAGWSRAYRAAFLVCIYACASPAPRQRASDVSQRCDGRVYRQAWAASDSTSEELRLVLRDDSTGVGVPCTWVFLTPESDSSRKISRASWYGLTDRSGVVVADSLGDGSWRLETRRLEYFPAVRVLVVRPSLGDTIVVPLKRNPLVQYDQTGGTHPRKRTS